MTKTTRHTAGSWRIGNGGWTIFGPPNGHPAPKVIATMEQGKSMKPLERKANAQLIAAAPELLVACREAYAAMVWEQELQGSRGESVHAAIGISKQNLDRAINRATQSTTGAHT